MAKLPSRSFSNPAAGGSVVKTIKAAGTMGKSTDTALTRRLKVNEALGKMKQVK